MQANRKNVSKDLIIEMTLALVEEKEGIKDVNLREIAKRIGCAHTNLYNYFHSLDEILWESLGRVLIKMMEYTGSIDFSRETDPKERFYSVISSIIDFSMDHTGWYRLIWLEAIGGEPSTEIAGIMRKPSEEFTEEIIKAKGKALSLDEAYSLGDMIHGYLHGELCKWINGRSLARDKTEEKAKILVNVRKLFEMEI